MKTTFRIRLIAVIVLFTATITLQAQTSPTVSSKYTVAQIDEMYKKHKIDRPKDSYPPQSISSKFSNDFPNARDIEWEKSNTFYEVEFEIGRDDYKAYYDMEGHLAMYKCDMPENLLPAIVRNAALAKYPNFRFDDVDKIVKGKETIYKVELEKGKLEIKMRLRQDGTIINEYFD